MTDEDIAKAKAEMPTTINSAECEARKKIAIEFLQATASAEPYLSNGLHRLQMWADLDYRGRP